MACDLAIIRYEARRNKQTLDERKAKLYDISCYPYSPLASGRRNYLAGYLMEGPEMGMHPADWERRKTWIIREWLKLDRKEQLTVN